MCVLGWTRGNRRNKGGGSRRWGQLELVGAERLNSWYKSPQRSLFLPRIYGFVTNLEKATFRVPEVEEEEPWVV